jgi:hypothetical protein
MAAPTLFPVTLVGSKSGQKSSLKAPRRQGGMIFHTFESKNGHNSFIINKYAPKSTSLFCDFLRFLCRNGPEFAHYRPCSSRLLQQPIPLIHRQHQRDQSSEQRDPGKTEKRSAPAECNLDPRYCIA